VTTLSQALETATEDQREQFEALDQWEKTQVEAYFSEYSRLSEALEKYEDVIVYHVDTFEDLARAFVDEGIWGDKKTLGTLINYIDFEKLGEDLRIDGYFLFHSETEGKELIGWIG
jgi:uncharacterized protein YukE